MRQLRVTVVLQASGSQWRHAACVPLVSIEPEAQKPFPYPKAVSEKQSEQLHHQYLQSLTERCHVRVLHWPTSRHASVGVMDAW